ncbi:MAG TPA: helix-hairpin-helix domain-containing protein, partial [Planctomycetaceae bacterium]|nr:helix-hairpin-helix domain-containing protein [Planctomycetaceae bacterium]
MLNADVARLFEDLADLLELDGANPFRVRAYRNAARTVEGLSADVAALVSRDPAELQQLDGIGKDLADKIVTIVRTRQLPQLEELKARIPAGVVQMLRIPGLGPKKVAALFKELGLDTLDALKQAAEQGRIADLKGFGKKTEQTILEGIALAAEAGQRVFLADAKTEADAIVA